METDVASNGRGSENAALSRVVEPTVWVQNAENEVNLGELQSQLGFLVRRVQLWVFREFNRKLARLDMTPAQYSVLAVVGANPGINQLAVAAALTIERAGLGRLIERLEARRFLRRLPSAVDRRSYVLHLTPQGRRALARMTALAHENERQLAAKFGPGEFDEVKRILAAFRDE
jgi:DNA-binding MarR family transcriptional regulator